jgi:hypothetical protein
MQTQITNKAIDKSDAKPKPTKTAVDQDKIIKQLRQEIKTLNKTIKDMQQKPDIQAINIAISKKLLSRVNAYLMEFVHDTGETMNLSDFICEAMDLYLYGEEQNKRIEEERKRVGSER